MNKPVVLQEGSYADADVNALSNRPVWQIKDLLQAQLRELFEVTHPQLVNQPDFLEKQTTFVEARSGRLKGDWVYFPWNGVLIHCVSRRDYYQLRTNRNRELITQEEQQELAKASIAIAGLSVGSNIALNLAYQGIASTFWLYEFDTLETTNLNRVKARLQDIGESKLELVMRQLYEIDPWLQIHGQLEGLTNANIGQLGRAKPKINLFFEIIDDFSMKITLRQQAKKYCIPIIVAANLGDSLLIDIERFDLDPNLPLFNGLLGDLPEEIMRMPDADKNAYAVKMVGEQNVPHRAIESVKQIGSTLVGRPQLASTVSLNGAFCAYFARRIILGQPLPSGRYKFDVAQVLNL